MSANCPHRLCHTAKAQKATHWRVLMAMAVQQANGEGCVHDTGAYEHRWTVPVPPCPCPKHAEATSAERG